MLHGHSSFLSLQSWFEFGEFLCKHMRDCVCNYIQMFFLMNVHGMHTFISLCFDNRKLQSLWPISESRSLRRTPRLRLWRFLMFVMGSKKIDVFQSCRHWSYKPASIRQRRCYTQNIDSLEHTAGPSEYPGLLHLAQFASRHPGTKGMPTALALEPERLHFHGNSMILSHSMIFPSLFFFKIS